MGRKPGQRLTGGSLRPFDAANRGHDAVRGRSIGHTVPWVNVAHFRPRARPARATPGAPATQKKGPAEAGPLVLPADDRLDLLEFAFDGFLAGRVRALALGRAAVSGAVIRR
jgi:hypothetical protein